MSAGTRGWALLLAVIGALAVSRASRAQDAAAITREGNGKGAPACVTCHGADGGGQAAAGYPRLAGVDPAYLQAQLDAFATGTRDNPVMAPIASALDEDERAALARYYGALSPPAALAEPRATEPAADSAGAVLATRGDWSRGVPGCVQCHGPDGVGVGASFPPLAGQPASYIEAQLRAWQQGTRRNDPLELMQHVSKALSAKDIAAVAAWFAAQPLPSAGGKP
ncbi:MAG: c-type cytochrome [Myxococcales bacterium]|nr:c-type cytochrome [Myxococcales bacterium]